MAIKHRTHSPYRPWTVWLALLIAVLGAIAPTPSRGSVRTADVLPIDICSIGPHQAAWTNTPDPSGNPEPITNIEHCSLCLPATTHVAPLHDVALQRLEDQGKVANSPPGQVDPFNDHSRTRPQPRAPPHD